MQELIYIHGFPVTVHRFRVAVQGYLNIGSEVLGSTFKVILEPPKLGTPEPLNPACPP
jgi:hypothetical protein